MDNPLKLIKVINSFLDFDLGMHRVNFSPKLHDVLIADKNGLLLKFDSQFEPVLGRGAN